jgi:hypothetical protein
MTLMVRDEADIIGPMIDHHLDQGVDAFIATDNGSVDGTYEILESYGSVIDLRRDPVQRKQQFSVVTAMAREAYTKYGADWVINADADEFWAPRERVESLHDVIEAIPKSLRSFKVPVIDMTGAPAARGSGLQRLIYRDTRPLTRLNELGLFAHSTPDAVHIGDATVEVAQGNHSVNLDQSGTLPRELELEALHLPWRSWEQFERKVRQSGLAYESNPDLLPSPNHHGMREYRRWKLGSLQAFYVMRHPDAAELAQGEATGELTQDRRLADAITSPITDEPFDERIEFAGRMYGPILSAAEQQARASDAAYDDRTAELLRYIDEGKQRIDGLIEEVAASRANELALKKRLDSTVEGQIVRLARAAKRLTSRDA